MDLFQDIFMVCGGVSTVVTLAILIVKPFREWLLGMKQLCDGQKCLLRADMLRTYYKHHNDDKIRQYELENFILEYKAYKALNGNSFVDAIYEDVMKWEVCS